MAGDPLPEQYVARHDQKSDDGYRLGETHECAAHATRRRQWIHRGWRPRVHRPLDAAGTGRKCDAKVTLLWRINGVLSQAILAKP